MVEICRRWFWRLDRCCLRPAFQTGIAASGFLLAILIEAPFMVAMGVSGPERTKNKPKKRMET